MDILKSVKERLIEKRRKIVKAIKSARKTRDFAPSAMESHHDTTRSQSERLVYALEEELHKLDRIIENLVRKENFLKKDSGGFVKEWGYVEIRLSAGLLKLFLVPEGLGGETIKDIKLVSSESSLGKVILGKRENEEFTFNEQRGRIEKVRGGEI